MRGIAANLLVGKLVPGVVARPGSACAVAGGAEGLLHALLSPGQDVGICAHGASDQDRLARQLIVDWNERVVRRECPEGQEQ